MFVQSLGTAVLIDLMHCGDRPGLSGPEPCWLLLDADMKQAQERARIQTPANSQQNQPAS